MKQKQTTLTGESQFKVRNKKIIKSGTLKFHPPTGDSPENIINDLENIHGRTKLYSLSSGGKDSMVTTNFLESIDKLEAVVHIKTNIGLKMTTDFLEDYCQERGWKLYIIEPNPKFTYASHVLQYGFPLAGFHRLIMGKLKYKTMRDFALTIDRKNHCLISGVRKYESKRRMGNYPYPIQSDGAMWFGCPMFYKKDNEMYEEFLKTGLKISPAYKLGFGTSGECMCGSFATPLEKSRIREVDKDLADYIDWLEEGIQKFGTKEAKRYPKWGDQPKMSDLEQQQVITNFFKENPEMSPVNEIEEFLCGAECGAGTMRAMVEY